MFFLVCWFFFFKQKTAYEMRISDWSSDVCSSDLFLKASGSSDTALKQQIRGELAWSRLLRRRVEPFVNVGDEEVEGIIERLKEAQGSEEYRVGEIFLSATPENKAEVMANAERIAEQIRGGDRKSTRPNSSN